jgi:hypothetical protein
VRRPPPPCPACGHVCHPTVAARRFDPDTPTVYRASHADHPDAPLRETRMEAQFDACMYQQGKEPA